MIGLNKNGHLFCGECGKVTKVLSDNDLCGPCSARLYPPLPEPPTFWQRITRAIAQTEVPND
jgi:hypothetical protein